MVVLSNHASLSLITANEPAKFIRPDLTAFTSNPRNSIPAS